MTGSVPETLLFATHNAGKVEEMRGLLAPFGVRLVSAAELGLDVPEETESSFEGNARLKALAACRATGLPALADDSGLCVDALGGAPGVRTADWAETPQGRDFLKAMVRTREMLIAAEAPQPWRAAFHCVLAYVEPGEACSFHAGIVQGSLVWPLRGALGHGYDPMFVPDGWSQTFAEMTAEEKNRISHRSRALQSFVRARFT